VQLKPRVYVVFWGPKWKSNRTDQSALRLLTAMYKGLGQAKDTWSLAAAQYPNKSGNHATFGTSVFAGSVIDTANPEKSVSFANLGAEAKKIAGHFKIKDTADAQIVIAAQSGTCFAPVDGLVFVGSCGVTPTQPPSNGYCGYHTAVADGSSYLTFTNLPFQLDAGMFCGENFLNQGSAGTLDGFSMVGGHEFAEAVTDPLGNAWIDNNDFSGGEIADKCAWGGSGWNQSPPDPSGNLALSTGHFAMQSLWSNVKHGCVMTGKLPFVVTKLGNQSITIGKAVHVQVSAHTTPRVGLTYHATGLPRGLSISRQGLIHGTPAGPAGTFHVKVTVSYYAGSFAFTFTWVIRR
jgi:Putative Ig domain